MFESWKASSTTLALWAITAGTTYHLTGTVPVAMLVAFVVAFVAFAVFAWFVAVVGLAAITASAAVALVAFAVFAFTSVAPVAVSVMVTVLSVVVAALVLAMIGAEVDDEKKGAEKHFALLTIAALPLVSTFLGGAILLVRKIRRARRGEVMAV